jgi:hypothetical protein
MGEQAIFIPNIYFIAYEPGHLKVLSSEMDLAEIRLIR